MTARALTTLAFVLCAVQSFAQSPIPAAGLAAEGAGDWTRALAVYRTALVDQPRDAAMWVRVADIEARLGNVAGSATALEQAVQVSPSDAALHARLSQTYAVLDRPAAALEAIERALALSPESVPFLQARATLATWAGQYDRAQETYRRLAKQNPNDPEVSLNLARVSAWSGRSDVAVDAYRRYLSARPDAAVAWAELARAEMWRGNYGAALDVLDTYQRRFGKDDRYTRELTAVLARSGRPREALALLEPQLAAQPNDHELNLTRTIARTAARLETPASTADPGVTFYRDSSSLEVRRVEPRVTFALGHGTTLAGGFIGEGLRARHGSGLEAIDGTEAGHDQTWIGATQQAGSVNFRGRIGQARIATDSKVAYTVGADFTPVDGVSFSLERSAGFFVVSPRTIGLRLQHVSHGGRLEWLPGARAVIAVDGRWQSLSDGNRRWEVTFSPRYSVARTSHLNLDIGAVASHLSTQRNLDHGYYDPRHYEYYGASAYPYWKLRERVGLGLALGVGAQRDDFSSAFRPGGNATAEAFIGIAEPWALKVTGGGSFNQRLGSGAFSGFSTGITLIRSFGPTSAGR
jgi:tetratricopeptide (TPR) repeat protein